MALIPRRSGAPVIAGLVALVLAAALLSVCLGAIHIPPGRVLEILTGGGSDPVLARDALVVLNIRLPHTRSG